jgi:histidine triad (HIT) family protein
MNNCIFCKIVQGIIPSAIVFKDEQITAFRDVNPQAPVHILIVPNKHVDGVLELEDSDAPLVARCVLAANDIARREGFAANGYRLVVNEGADANQTVEHLHVHLLAGRRMGWPPG